MAVGFVWFGFGFVVLQVETGGEWLQVFFPSTGTKKPTQFMVTVHSAPRKWAFYGPVRCTGRLAQDLVQRSQTADVQASPRHASEQGRP